MVEDEYIPEGAEGSKFDQESKEKLSEPMEFTSQKDLDSFYDTYFRNNQNMFGHMSEGNARRYLIIMKKSAAEDIEQGKPAHFFGIKEGEQVVATTKLDVEIDEREERFGDISFVTVDKKYRGQGLAQRVMDRVVECAKEYDCSYLSLEARSDNPTALTAYFKDNYVLTDIKFHWPGDKTKAGFILTKRINQDSEYDQKRGTLGELQEVRLVDLSKIEELVNSGWVGIDIKNLGNLKDIDSGQWNLILEKK